MASAQREDAIDEFLDLLQLERRDGAWVGRTPDWYGPVVFGGIALALTISAACRDAPGDVRWLGPSRLRDDGTREATHRHWFRLPRALDHDPHLHVALVGFATDWTGAGGRPHHLDEDITGMISLDHAAWFHRPARADEWLLQDVQALVNAGGRGTLRGVIRNTDGLIVASMAQEMLLHPVDH